MKNKIEKLINNEKFADFDYTLNEEMKNHTTFKLGGPCDILIKPKSEDELISCISLCREIDIPYLVIGKGSNMIVSDSGIRGAIIKLVDNFSEIRVMGDGGTCAAPDNNCKDAPNGGSTKSAGESENHAKQHARSESAGSEHAPKGTTIFARSGASLKKIAEFALENSLTGLAFAHGIPGNLGGAITMNAGAYGGEIKNVVSKVRLLNKDLQVVEVAAGEMSFGYRRSIVQDSDYVVLGAYFSLEKGDKSEIKAEMDDYMCRRRDKQPLNYPSAGSIFKRPEGYFAGKLIQDCNLKGLSYGGAMVSPKHAGFIVNTGDASANDVLKLVEIVQKTVFDTFDVKLEREVRLYE